MAALALLVAGCAASGPRPPFIVEGTENAVSVNWAHSPRGTTGALEAAEAHCQKYNRHAQFVGKVTDLELAYNCVR
ncbi:hypothetical protein [Hydrogenophaga aquatica]